MKSLFFRKIGQNVSKFISKNRKFVLLFLVVVTLLSVFDASSVLADNPVPQSEQVSQSKVDASSPTGFTETYAVVISILNKVLVIASALIGLLTALVTLFLSPEWVTGSIFGLDEHLKTIWVIVSNVVYVIFIGLFITIAFMNIIGKGENTWALKKALPKFFIGVLMVPISWMLVQTIISISSILTVTALTLPYETFKDRDFFTTIAKPNAERNICNSFIVDFGASLSDKSKDNPQPKDPNKVKTTDGDLLGKFVRCRSEDDKINLYEYFNGRSNGELGVKNSIFGIMSVYVYGVFNLDKVEEISYDGKEDPVNHFTQLAVSTIVSTLFVIIFFILLVAIFVVLFTRGILLWFYSVISPVFGIFYFFGDGAIEASKKYNFFQLIKLALVPVFVSLALSFGLLFIVITGNQITRGDQPENKKENYQVWDNTITTSNFTFELKGTKSTINLFPDFKSTVGVLILQIFGLLFLWIAVITALKSSKAMESVVRPFDEFGSKIGSLAMSAPSYAPIIPGKDGTRTSLKGVNDMVGRLESVMSNKTNMNNEDWLRSQGFVNDDAGKGIKEINSYGAIRNEEGKIEVDKGKRKDITKFFYNLSNNTLKSSPHLTKKVQELLGLSDKQMEDFDANKKEAIKSSGLDTELNEILKEIDEAKKKKQVPKDGKEGEEA